MSLAQKKRGRGDSHPGAPVTKKTRNGPDSARPMLITDASDPAWKELVSRLLGLPEPPQLLRVTKTDDLHNLVEARQALLGHPVAQNDPEFQAKCKELGVLVIKSPGVYYGLYEGEIAFAVRIRVIADLSQLERAQFNAVATTVMRMPGLLHEIKNNGAHNIPAIRKDGVLVGVAAGRAGLPGVLSEEEDDFVLECGPMEEDATTVEDGRTRAGSMYGLGWRAGMDCGKLLGIYAPNTETRASSIGKEEFLAHMTDIKTLRNCYAEGFATLYPHGLKKMREQQFFSKAPVIGDAEWIGDDDKPEYLTDLFASNLTSSCNDFANASHTDNDHAQNVYGMWWASTMKSRTNFSMDSTDHSKIKGGAFCWPEFRVLVDFESTGSSLVDLYWRGCVDRHFTLGSRGESVGAIWDLPAEERRGYINGLEARLTSF